jgi:predicted rRNA methylase YqxC with S4 and FtsJ domains
VAARRRLDAELVRRDLTASRTEAQSLIAANRVLVNGSIADKPSRQVAPSDAVLVDGPPARFVGRGAEKLDHALDEFDIDVTGRLALDVGASTGGFTDCLLQVTANSTNGCARTTGSPTSSGATSATQISMRSAGPSSWSSLTCRSSRSLS